MASSLFLKIASSLFCPIANSLFCPIASSLFCPIASTSEFILMLNGHRKHMFRLARLSVYKKCRFHKILTVISRNSWWSKLNVSILFESNMCKRWSVVLTVSSGLWNQLSGYYFSVIYKTPFESGIGVGKLRRCDQNNRAN